MRLYSKEELIVTFHEILNQGWHKSVKLTRNTRNDGAVGNTFENLLGIVENNLLIPNTQEWELIRTARTHIIFNNSKTHGTIAYRCENCV